MRKKASSWWYDLQDSLWFIPAVMTAAAVVLALVMVRVDQTLLLGERLGSDATWLFGGGAEGARGVLSAIAGTMITVTGLIFSITVVALQLASSQFSPRVLRNFTGDRGNQVVLGVFIATFTYSLLILRSVRSAEQDFSVFVPSASITMAIVLTVISIGFLIYFIHHSARSMQAAIIINNASTDTMALIDELFPKDVGRPAPDQTMTVPSVPPFAVRADEGGYLQGLDAESVFDTAEVGRVTVRVDVGIGEFLLPGMTLASVWPATPLEAGSIDMDKIREKVRKAFTLGAERTLAHDVDYGFRQLADIAVKALSPGINDPTTASMCVDRLGAALATIGQREHPREVRTGEDGSVRLLVAGPSFDSLVRTAFEQIRHYGAGDVVVAQHVVITLGRVADIVSNDRRAPLAREARLMTEAIERAGHLEADLVRVRLAGAWAVAGATG